MDKREYIQLELIKATKFAGQLLLLFASFTVLLLSFLDYYVVPDNFPKFIAYRIICALSLLALHFIFRRVEKKDVQSAIIILATIITGIMVEIMILASGGYRSSYYVGLALVEVFVLGFLPISINVAAIVAASLNAIYVLPILLFDDISDIKVFINNNLFLLFFMIAGLSWRYFNQKLLVNNIALRYDLGEQKQYLEDYSHQLENMVAERTKELSKSNKWHQALFENATDGIVVLDRNGIIMNANERACEMHGFSKEALVGSHSSLLEVDENRVVAAERFQQLLQGESLVYETAHYKKNGSRVFLEVSSKAIPIHDEVFIQSFQRDITEKKKIQEHLFQAQKMDSIGMLAGGIAHDFNNVLTAILGYTDLIRRDVGANEKVLGRLSVIENASRKAGRMVSQLLGFSRKSEIEMVPFDINAVVHDTVKLLERVIDKRVVIRLDLNERIPSVQGDVNKVEQVMMNFMVNARDAMPYGGIITVTSTAIDAIPGAAGVPPYIPAGRYVVLSVADTGVGIPEEIQRKIFEPFYTTKERGKGTGLGLAMVYGVVTEHRGYVTVQSKINQGTTFTVYFPVAAKATAETRKQAALSMQGNETIMLVEDDEHILEYIKVELENSGYKVIATTNPMSAIDAYSRMSREIALVITDVVMPLIDGRELMKRIAEINPRARFLAISEHEQRTKRGDDVTPDIFLQKPFDAVEVLSAVRRILDDGKKLQVK